MTYSPQGYSPQHPYQQRPSKRILISTGEVSGDLQGALLIEALKRQAAVSDLKLEIVALGGDRMAQAGASLLAHTSGIGSVGLVESLPFVLPTLQIQRRVKRYLSQHAVDAVVLLDYMGPNLKLGTYLKRSQPALPLIYYIAPQEWVWSIGSGNTAKLVKATDRLLAIFPEEARYYRSHGADVTWVGHPIVDHVLNYPSRSQARRQLGLPEDARAIALLPASRRQELTYLAPVIFETAARLQAAQSDLTFWVPLSLARYRPQLEAMIDRYGLQATRVEHQPQVVIAAADLAICKSGTVNLETALMDVPQLVLYRVNPLTFWVARHLLRFSIPFMSPANLALMEPIVPEFLQGDATADKLTAAALDLLQNDAHRQRMRQDYGRMRQALGEPGACDRAAAAILAYMT
ncbi:MAG: lipid-A-disaccharide synthase [Elainellaceae cyanobacterium]